MLKSITVINALGDVLKLDLWSPESSGYIVRKAGGLGPVKATINTSTLATMDGDIFNSARAGGRNVVLELGFLGSRDIAQLRRQTYQWFPLKGRVDLLIESDTRIYTTYGYVESNEPVIFDSVTGTQISIVCPDTYLMDADGDGRMSTYMYGVDPLFEFPFENDSLTAKTIIMGEARHIVEATVFYEGDSNPGLVVEMFITGTVVSPSIHNLQTLEKIQIDSTKIPGGIVAGDKITIVTEKGSKSATLLRNGASINILNSLGREINWFTLDKGDNLFAYTAVSGAPAIQAIITNKVLFEGV